MTQQANQLLNYYQSDTVPHVDSLRWVWQKVRTPAARYAEALTYMQEDNYAAARTVIEDLPEEHDLKEKEEGERYRMLAFIDFLQTVHASGRSSGQLTEGEQAVLEGIVDDQRDRAATWAQNILCFYYNKCRAPLTGGSGATPKARRLGNENVAQAFLANLRMYPNPAMNYVVFEVNLDTEPISSAIVIQDIAGRVLKRLSVSSKEQQLVVDCREFAPGTYSVLLTNNGATVQTKNLIIRQ
jgi:hypothetical protein